uniref:Ig-like domain-containing protein n=1 Tax=Oryzias latipes TaxID=8090 RepID=A0A3P9L4Y3_ORYLA
MVTPAQFVVILTCLLSGNSAQSPPLGSSSSDHQKSVFLSAHIGETVTLQCFYDGVYLQYILWYKHILGRKPKPISLFSKYGNNPRFTLTTSDQTISLIISNLKQSDSAIYFCVAGYQTHMNFSAVLTVNVKGSGSTIQASVDQSSSENIHAGDSVTLNCTVHTGSCDEEHRVYWFKDSHPGLIYTHGGRNDQCERKNNTQTHSCVYELPIKNLTEPHAGIYYCAVVSCGHILFGNRTKLDLTDSAAPVNSVILNTLVGLLTVMSVLVVFLLFLLWKINKSNNCTSTEERSPAAPSRSSEAENKDTENLHYAAVNVKKSNRSRRQNDNSNNDCLYASVRQQN